MQMDEIGAPTALMKSSGAGGGCGKEWFQASKRPIVVFILFVLLSAPIEFANLGEPLLGQHEFRQTQTALSVWEMREHGVSWLHPRLPLYGPPWELPLEYPVFQLAAAAVDSVAPWHNLDVSIRVTAIIFFYLAALALYLLARQLFESPTVALFTAGIFLFSPYNIYWGRTSMIEYAADFFALAYLLCFIRWSSKPGWILFTLTIIFGVLGCLTKITSFAIPLLVVGVIMGLWVFAAVQRKFNSRERQEAAPPASTDPGFFGRTLRPSEILLAGVLVLVPLLIGFGYVHFSDQIKAQSPYTAWLCSSSLKKWNYGTLAQRLSFANWGVIFTRMRSTVSWDMSIPLLVGFFVLPFRIRGFEKLPRGNFWVGCALSLAPLVVVLCFFNLYCVHSYYFISPAICLALCTGVALDFLLGIIKRPFIKILLLLFLAGVWLHTLAPFVPYMVESSSPDLRVIYLSQAGKIIPKDDPVIVVTPGEYNSFIPYNLKHRAFMAMFIDKPVDTRPLVETDYLKQNGFHWLLVDGRAPVTLDLAKKIMSRWKFARAVRVTFGPYALYSLSDQ
jgi:hypothetical protein